MTLFRSDVAANQCVALVRPGFEIEALISSAVYLTIVADGMRIDGVP
jgi:hypothetical protein